MQGPRSDRARAAGSRWARRPRHAACVCACALLALALVLVPSPACAHVFFSRDAALKLAFPHADKIDVHHVFLSHGQAKQLQRLSGPHPSRVVTVYVGCKAGRVLRYAVIETRILRLRRATFMVVVGPTAKQVQAMHVLAFEEPIEYMPTKTWLRQFRGKTLGADLRMWRGIAGIAGSTLSALAANNIARWSLAVLKIERAVHPVAAAR